MMFGKTAPASPPSDTEFTTSASSPMNTSFPPGSIPDRQITQVGPSTSAPQSRSQARVFNPDAEPGMAEHRYTPSSSATHVAGYGTASGSNAGSSTGEMNDWDMRDGTAPKRGGKIIGPAPGQGNPQGQAFQQPRMPKLQLVSDLPGHSEPAWSVVFNPSRPLLASCSTDKTIRLYSYIIPPSPSSEPAAPKFTFLQSIQTDHQRTLRSLSWSPSGKTLAVGSFDSTVSIWEESPSSEGIDVPSGSRSHGHSPGDEDEDDDMDGQLAQGANEVKEWECITTLEGHDSECKSVGYSSDGALLASSSRDKSVWVWEVQPDADFECISVMMEHTQDVKSLTWHPKEEILASASYDASILLFADDPDSDWCPFQKLIPALPARSPSAFTSSSSTSHATAMAVPKTKSVFEVPPLKDPETIWSLAFSQDGMYLASGGDGGGIRIWARGGTSTESRWTEISHTKAHDPRACFSLSWTNGGLPAEQNGLGLLASAGGDNKLCVWQVTKSADTKNPVGSGTIPLDVQLSAAATVPRAHGIYDINSVSWCKRTVGEHSQGAIREKEERIQRQTEHVLASCADDGSVKVWHYIV